MTKEHGVRLVEVPAVDERVWREGCDLQAFPAAHAVVHIGPAHVRMTEHDRNLSLRILIRQFIEQ